MLLLAVTLLDRAGRGGGFGPRVLGPLLFLFLLFLLGLGLAWLIRRNRSAPGGPGSPLETLQARFARGEIDQAEYEHRRAVLIGAETVPAAPQPSAWSADPSPDPTTGEAPPAGGTPGSGGGQ